MISITWDVKKFPLGILRDERNKVLGLNITIPSHLDALKVLIALCWLTLLETRNLMQFTSGFPRLESDLSDEKNLLDEEIINFSISLCQTHHNTLNDA